MFPSTTVFRWLMALALALTGTAAPAAEFPTPQSATAVLRDFRFHTGEVMPELRVHYTTVGAPTGEPVLVPHGTAGSGTGLLSPTFGGELFTTGLAKFWAAQLGAWLPAVPRRP